MESSLEATFVGAASLGDGFLCSSITVVVTLSPSHS